MIWPRSTDYAEAVQNLRTSMTDEELRCGEVACNSLGLPTPWAGNFADVYKVHCPASGNTWALKCFTRQVRGLQERYRSIASHLDEARLPFTVGFQYLEQGILIAGQRFPVLKMRWVEGQTLTQFTEGHLDRPRNLKMLLDLWVKLAARLREAQVAHADLQHGNVLLVPVSGGSLALRLVDYDGMYVPALAGTRSGELGHPAYQHPQRLREGTYSIDVDRFSHLAIYGSVYCLSLGRRELWDRFNNGDNLLFREADFQNPGKSDLFRALWELGDADAQAIVGRLVLACQRPLTESPLLNEVIVNGHVRPLSPGKLSAVESLLSVGKAAPLRAPAKPEISPTKPPDSDLRPPEGLPPPSNEQSDSIRLTAAGLLPRRVTWPFAASVRRADRVLAVLAGKGNTILHNAFRVAAVAMLAGVSLAATATLYQALKSNRSNELAALQAAEREATRIRAEAEKEAGRIKADAQSEASRIKAEAAENEAARIKAEAAKNEAARIKAEAARIKAEAAENEAARTKAEAEKSVRPIKDKPAQSLSDKSSAPPGAEDSPHPSPIASPGTEDAPQPPPPADASPPVVIETVPKGGAANVSARLTQIRVKFNRVMRDRSWSWVSTDSSHFPKITGKPSYLADKQTCVLPVKLEPHMLYVIWINADEEKGFMDTDGHPADPYRLTFRTRQGVANALGFRERLCGTRWRNTNGVLFEWDASGALRRNGKPMNYEVMSDLRVSLRYGPNHIDTFVFDQDLQRFKQYSTSAPRKNPLFTGKRLP